MQLIPAPARIDQIGVELYGSAWCGHKADERRQAIPTAISKAPRPLLRPRYGYSGPVVSAQQDAKSLARLTSEREAAERLYHEAADQKKRAIAELKRRLWRFEEIVYVLWPDGRRSYMTPWDFSESAFTTGRTRDGYPVFITKKGARSAADVADDEGQARAILRAILEKTHSFEPIDYNPFVENVPEVQSPVDGKGARAADGVLATDASEEAPELTVIEDKAATNQFGHELQGHNEPAVSMPAEPNSQKRQKRQTLEAAIKAEVEIKYPRGIPSYVTASEVKRTIGIPAHINTYRRAIGRKK